MKNTEDLENEVWKTHKCGIRVSSLGRVETRIKGKHYGCGRGNGYLGAYWQGNGYYVHILVAECFVPNPNNLPYVNHKDENKQNNRADNLEWCTHQYNLNYGTAIERRVKNTDWEAIGEKVAEKISIPILQLNKDTMEVVKEWKSSMEAQRDGGFNNGNINSCLKGRYKTCGGYIWRYKEGSGVPFTASS